MGVTPLEPSQRSAADALVASVRSGTFGVSLLDGVTGSGKTEVYFEAIAEALRAGRQSLILLPEIALTAQFLDRFAGRFGTRAGRMAFGRLGPPPQPDLGRSGVGRGPGRGGRAIEPVPAV